MFEYSHFSPTPRNSELATNRRRSAVEYFAAADSFEIVYSLGMDGKPEVCVARSSSEIVFPFPSATLSPAGKYFATGSFNPTSFFSAISASSSAVNTFVTDPISNTVSPSRGCGSSKLRSPAEMILRPSDEIVPTTIPTPFCSPPSALIRSAANLRISLSLRTSPEFCPARIGARLTLSQRQIQSPIRRAIPVQMHPVVVWVQQK